MIHDYTTPTYFLYLIILKIQNGKIIIPRWYETWFLSFCWIRHMFYTTWEILSVSTLLHQLSRSKYLDISSWILPGNLEFCLTVKIQTNSHCDVTKKNEAFQVDDCQPGGWSFLLARGGEVGWWNQCQYQCWKSMVKQRLIWIKNKNWWLKPMVKVNGEPSFSQTFSQQFYVVFFVSPAKAHFQTQPFVGWFWQNVRQMLEFTKNYIRAFIRGSWIMNMQLYRDV